jgi:hypothetical protein
MLPVFALDLIEGNDCGFSISQEMWRWRRLPACGVHLQDAGIVFSSRCDTNLYSKVRKWLGGPGLALGHPIRSDGIISIPLNANECGVVCPVSESDWVEHLRRASAYSFFQTPRWSGALCRFEPRFRDSTTLFAWDETSVLLPLVAIRKAPSLEILESMPWGTYGGWVAERGLTEEEERRCLRALLSVRRPQISIISWPGTALSCKPDRFLDFETHRLDLSAGFGEIWARRYAPRHRTKITKAQRSGLEATIDNSTGGVQAYKRLYRESMRRWQGDLAFDPDFLDQWIDAPRDEVSLWLCLRQSEILAGALIFYSPMEAHYWSGALDVQFSEFHPNNFLLSRTIEDAVERGCRTYNFASSAGLPGVIQFKEQFGPDVVPYRRSVFMHPLWRSVERVRRLLRP